MAHEVDPERDPVSAFFREQQHALVAAAAEGAVLDLACGRGRHSLAAAALGLDVLAVDRSAESLDALALAAASRTLAGRVEAFAIDLESDSRPILPRRSFAAILVFRYLHRALTPQIESWLAPGGLLLYETFTTAQRELGWGPSRDAFLLEPGELPQLFPALVTEHFEEGPTREPKPAHTARLRARRPR